MATSRWDAVVQPASRVAPAQDPGRMTDGHLLQCFLARGDEAAFAELVRRHGPMVFGVCRRVLAHAQDAEDAFQATFLVLARRAASVAPRELVGNWLYGVAYRTALKAKAAALRRRGRERQVREMPEPAAPEGDVWAELRPLLDRELERLPEKYRAPVVLCDLGGQTHKEAARQLGCPEATVSTRLARARDRLARRLAPRGVALSGVGLGLALAHGEATAHVPGPLGASAVRAATLFAAGRAPAGAVPAAAAALAEGVVRAMLFAKLRVVLAVLLALGVVGLGAGGFAYRSVAADRPAAPEEDKAKADLEKLQGTWALVSMERGGQKAPEDEVKGLTLVVKGDKLTVTDGKGKTEEAVLELDPTKDPKEIDLKVNEDGAPKVHKGIYKLEGDTLTLCLSHPPEERPSTFATKEGARWPQLHVLKKKAAK
jgi:RNA polymerase sigma-70 factor (ECF subfamily)